LFLQMLRSIYVNDLLVLFILIPMRKEQQALLSEVGT